MFLIASGTTSCLPISTAGWHAASRCTASLRPLHLTTGIHRTVEKRALRTFAYTPQTGKGIRKTFRSRFARGPAQVPTHYGPTLTHIGRLPNPRALRMPSRVPYGTTREAQGKIRHQKDALPAMPPGSESPLRSEFLDRGMCDSRKPNACRTTRRRCTIVQNTTPEQLDPVLEAP